MSQELKKPNPVVDEKELKLLDSLTIRYEKLIKPSCAARLGSKVMAAVPSKVKDGIKELGSTISQQELMAKMMSIVEDGFTEVQTQAAKFTISEKQILGFLGKHSSSHIPASLEEVCLLRSYDIEKAVGSFRTSDLFLAMLEGGATGAFGFWGLPFNLVLSLFLYFRAVQCIAMFYGYDVKNDSTELVIAGEVFTNALSPAHNDTNNEALVAIGKIMAMGEAAIVKEASKKTWSDMIARGGIPLLLTQIRALANKAAANALKKAGQKGLEHNIFRNALTTVGRRMTLKSVGKTVPVFSAIFGALIDTAQMKTILEYADVFYHKRFLLEKDEREQFLLNENIVLR